MEKRETRQIINTFRNMNFLNGCPAIGRSSMSGEPKDRKTEKDENKSGGKLPLN